MHELALDVGQILQPHHEHVASLLYVDELTGVHNRRLLLRVLDGMVQQAQRTGTHLGLVALDIDRFRQLNDSMGHSVGDAVLKGVASLLRDMFRGSDVIARMGSDEFIAVLPGLREKADLSQAVARLRERFAKPLVTDKGSMPMSACIGSILYPESADSPEELLRRVDLALDAAKSRGPNHAEFFKPELDERARQQVALQLDLPRAIEEDQLRVFFQPQFNLKTGKLVGAEALVRWMHPSHGLLSPGSFIPSAEQSGLIVQVGDWVLRATLRELAAWQATVGAVSVAVNVAALQMLTPGFVARVHTLLRDFGLEHALLKLELTETGLLHDPVSAFDLMHSLTDAGVEFCIDDFGTGYSSMSTLQRYPFSVVKIDRSFIAGMSKGPKETHIVRSVVALARSLEMTVIAEGIETQEQVAALIGAGCHIGQGYLLGRPVPADEFCEAHLKSATRRRRSAPGRAAVSRDATATAAKIRGSGVRAELER